MSKDEHMTMTGTVIDQLPGSKFKVKLENNAVVICVISGKLRIHNISILVGDLVDVELSPYDLTQGRISWRHI